MSSSASLDLDVAAELDAATRTAVLALAGEAAHADGAFPLDDQVLFDLESTNPRSHVHLVARRPGDSSIVGYAHLDTRSPEMSSAHAVIHPMYRRHGLGAALVTQLVDIASSHNGKGNGGGRQSRLRVWSHGNHPGAAALARSLGWERVRDLLQMRLSRETPIAEPSYPPDVEVRTFVPGRDEEGWVEVNAKAFSDHPEQGRLTVDDLRQRERQPWFDPAGFFVAVRDDHMIGSHWTKVHVDDTGTPAVGEVYVIGIDPTVQGLGIGKALTLTGLHHLRDQGLDVMLYADADNQAAVALYERIGFTVARVDVMYERLPTASDGH